MIQRQHLNSTKNKIFQIENYSLFESVSLSILILLKPIKKESLPAKVKRIMENIKK